MKITTCIVLAGAMLALDAHAGSHAEPVTDPAELAALGLPPDAIGAMRLVASAGAPAVPRGSGTPHAVTGDDFKMASSDSAYHTDGRSHLWCPAGESYRIASAAIDVPAGRRFAYLDLWGVDESATNDITAILYSTCHPPGGPGGPSNMVLASVTSDGAPGAFFAYATIPDHAADPAHCTYSINLLLGASGTCEGTALVLHKVRVVSD